MDDLNNIETKILEHLQSLSEKEQKIILKQLGHTKSAPKIYDFSNEREKRKRIGLTTDSHYGCKHHNYKFEAHLFNRFKREKVDFIIDAGDLLDGVNMHYGQFWEQNHSTYEGQIQDFLNNRPIIDGVKQYFISGNHMTNGLDKKIGFSSGKELASKRDDLVWLADIEADIIMTDKFKIKVLHPGDGSSYALSYKPQKKIEAMSASSKPEMLVMGHYHKSAFFYFREVYSFLAGTTCEQTSFMRAKGLSADVGGWIIDLYFNKKGEMTRLKPEFIRRQ